MSVRGVERKPKKFGRSCDLNARDTDAVDYIYIALLILREIRTVMSSNAPTPIRRLQVYVEVPPSPHLLVRRNKPTTGDRLTTTGSTLHVHGSSLKENAPLTGSSSALVSCLEMETLNQKLDKGR